MNTLDTGWSGPPWLAILRAYHRILWLGEVNAARDLTEGRLEVLCFDASWTLHYVFLHLTDFNLSPFSVVNCNCEYNSIH